jgi:hypothetical protein
MLFDVNICAIFVIIVSCQIPILTVVGSIFLYLLIVKKNLGLFEIEKLSTLEESRTRF